VASSAVFGGGLDGEAVSPICAQAPKASKAINAILIIVPPMS
jgi:hypothetical protein